MESANPRTGPLIASGEAPPRLLLDAGPVLAVIDDTDEHQGVASIGLRELQRSRTRLVIPLSVVYEVYKRVAYDISVETAHQSLLYMRQSCQILYLDPEEFEGVARLVSSMRRWEGSLEDATLAMIGIRQGIPVWTFNYRDLNAFRDLQFRNPA